MIDWISVDDVLYPWDGQEIVCETGVGYSTRIDGNHLDGLEINGGADTVVGRLFIDFADGTLAFESLDEEISGGVIHYSVNGIETVADLSQLPHIATLNDVIAIDDNAEIWSSLATISQVHADNPEADGIHHQSDYIAPAMLLDEGDATLDLVLQNIGETEPVTVAHDPGVMPADFDSVYVNSGVSDPLDALHYYNAGGNGQHG